MPVFLKREISNFSLFEKYQTSPKKLRMLKKSEQTKPKISRRKEKSK